MSIKEQALKEYSETTCKNQWYICQCMFMFNKLKDIVEPENGKKFQERGYWFKCLTDNVKHIRGQFIGHPEYIFKRLPLKILKITHLKMRRNVHSKFMQMSLLWILPLRSRILCHRLQL